jgi:hypothetical protein
MASAARRTSGTVVDVFGVFGRQPLAEVSVVVFGLPARSELQVCYRRCHIWRMVDRGHLWQTAQRAAECLHGSGAPYHICILICMHSAGYYIHAGHVFCFPLY